LKLKIEKIRLYRIWKNKYWKVGPENNQKFLKILENIIIYVMDSWYKKTLFWEAKQFLFHRKWEEKCY